MTQAEVIALARTEAQKVYQENEEKYKTMASLPAWAKAAVEQVYRELGLSGTGAPGEQTQIDGSETYIRALTVIATKQHPPSRPRRPWGGGGGGRAPPLAISPAGCLVQSAVLV